MALFSKLIEWVDDSRNVMVYRAPASGKNINRKSKLTVRESQAAVFVHKGQIADVFGPGLYNLDTEILPILSRLAGWQYAFQTPITADVYFVNTKQFTGQRWGTTNPIAIRDPEFGIVRVRGYGSFSFRVDDPAVFLRELFGTNGSYRTEDVAEYLRSVLLSGFNDALGESGISVIDLAGNSLELNEVVKAKIQARFREIGLELASFVVENVSVPEEIEKALDERARLGILGGSTDAMTRIAAAEAIREAAKNPGIGGAAAGAGVGIGVGAEMGRIVGDALRGAPAASPAPAAEEKRAAGRTCPACGAAAPASAKFCPECGGKLGAGKFCPECGAAVAAGSKFCPECGKKL